MDANHTWILIAGGAITLCGTMLFAYGWLEYQRWRPRLWTSTTPEADLVTQDDRDSDQIDRTWIVWSRLRQTARLLLISGLALMLTGILVALLGIRTPSSGSSLPDLSEQLRTLSSDVQTIKHSLSTAIQSDQTSTAEVPAVKDGWISSLTTLSLLVILTTLGIGLLVHALRHPGTPVRTVMELTFSSLSFLSVGSLLGLSIEGTTLLSIEWPAQTSEQHYSVRIDELTIQELDPNKQKPTAAGCSGDNCEQLGSQKVGNSELSYLRLSATPSFESAAAELDSCDDISKLKLDITSRHQDGYQPLFLLIVGKTDRQHLSNHAQHTFDSNSALGMRRAAWVRDCLLEDEMLGLKNDQLVVLASGPKYASPDSDKKQMASDRVVNSYGFWLKPTEDSDSVARGQP